MARFLTSFEIGRFLRHKKLEFHTVLSFSLAVLWACLLKYSLVKHIHKENFKTFFTQLENSAYVPKKERKSKPSKINPKILIPPYPQKTAVCGLDCGPHGQCLGSSCVCSKGKYFSYYSLKLGEQF